MSSAEEICRFVLELEQYTAECGMKKRVLDTISDVKRSMQEEISPNNLSELGRLVEYIGKQEEAQEGGDAVSKEDMQEKMREYYERCLNDNRAQELRCRSDCQVFIEEAVQDMQDYTLAEANFDTVMDEGKFCDAFYRIGQKYAQHTNEMMEQYAEAASDNYHRMMDKIRGMIQASGAEQITRRDFYQKWAAHYEAVKKGCADRISRTDGGEKEIAGFAQKHVGGVADKVKKQKRRQRMYKNMPLYIVISCIVLLLGGKLLWRLFAREEEISEGIGQVILDNTMSILENAADILKVLAIAVPCMILLLVFWYLYMRGVDKQYHTWVCSAVSVYLSAEMDNFRRDDLLNIKLDNKFQSLDAYMKEEYERLISGVCGGIMEKGEDDYRQSRFRELYSRWETIRMEG